MNIGRIKQVQAWKDERRQLLDEMKLSKRHFLKHLPRMKNGKVVDQLAGEEGGTKPSLREQVQLLRATQASIAENRQKMQESFEKNKHRINPDDVDLELINQLQDEIKEQTK